MINVINVLIGIFVLFVPGYFLSFLVFHRPERLDITERIGVSVGLSALVDMLIVVILAQSWLKALEFWPFMEFVLVFSAVCAVLTGLKGDSRQTLINFWTSSSKD